MDIKKLGTELLGTMWLVLGGCGAAVVTPIFGAAIAGVVHKALFGRD